VNKYKLTHKGTFLFLNKQTLTYKKTVLKG